MLKLAIAGTLVVTLYSAYWLGSARGATAMLIHARDEQAAIVTDYEDALSWAQVELDALKAEYRQDVTELENELAVERDTREYWRTVADQKAAEANRYRSLAAFRGGEAY